MEQGRIHLPISREIPREARLPPGAAVRRGRKQQVVAGGGGGGELRLEARGQAFVAQHRPLLVKDRPGNPPRQAVERPRLLRRSAAPGEKRDDLRGDPDHVVPGSVSGLRPDAHERFPPEEVGRRVRDDRLRGRNPEYLLVRVPVLGPDPVGVPGGGHYKQLQSDLRAGSGGPAENGDREPFYPVREIQLGLAVDLLVEVVGAEGPRGLEEFPLPLRREGSEGGIPGIRRPGRGDGDREEQQRREKDRLHPASRAWARRPSLPTGSRSRQLARHDSHSPQAAAFRPGGRAPYAERARPSSRYPSRYVSARSTSGISTPRGQAPPQ